MRPTQADLVLQKQTPIEVVPFQGEFEALEKDGHRLLLARDGLWLEARRRWVHVVWPIALQGAIAIPAGSLRRNVKLGFGAELRGHVEAFIERAKEAHPVEVGAVCIWAESSGELQLKETRTLRAGVGHLKYERPQIEEGEHVVVDLHSHGPFEAEFSDTDLEDTGSEVVLAGVVGRLDGEVQVKITLFVCGLQIPIAWKRESQSACGTANDLCEQAVAAN